MPRRKIWQDTLPPLDGLPPNMIANWEAMESLAEGELRTILLEVIPARTQRQISRLLQKQQAEALIKQAQEKLAEL